MVVKSFSRVLQGIFVVLVVTILSFLLLRMIPGDPARIMAPNAPEETLQSIRESMGVSEPKLTQLRMYFEDLVNGDMGYSYFKNETVTSLIGKAVPKTLIIMLNALVLSTIIGGVLGTVAALKRQTIVDRIISSLAVFLQALPNYFMATVLILFFGVELGLFPVMGYDGYIYTVMPSMVVALPLIASFTKCIRNAMMEGYEQDYIKAARARGVKSNKILIKYGLRSAVIPYLSTLGNLMPTVIGGVLVAEWIFSYPGLGFETLNALYRRDYLLVQGCVLVISSFFIFVTTAIDLSYTFLDPRLRKQ